ADRSVESARVSARAAVPEPDADIVPVAAAHLATPGLVVLAGPPGAGRSTALRRLGAAFRGPVFTGGGLAMLRAVPALALARAVRAKLPAHDPALLALAEHCRIAVTLRTPHRLPDGAEAALRVAAAAWLPVPTLPDAAATA